MAKPLPSIKDVLTEIDHWFDEHIRKPPIAHDVLSYNQAYAALQELKNRLSRLVTGEDATTAAPPADEAQTEPATPSSEDAAAAPNPKSKPAA